MNLVSGGMFDKVFSILPPFVNRDIEKVRDGIEVVYSRRLRLLPIVGKLAAIIEQVTLLSKIHKESNVWLYNLTPLNAVLVKLLRWFKPSVKIFVIVLDFTPGDKRAERWLPTINSCDGRIILSTSDKFEMTNTICLPGVTPLERSNWPTIINPTKEFILSGQLSDKISLLSRLLPIFASHPDWILNITGIAPKMAVDYAEKHSNIKCHGKCPYDEFLNVLHRSSFLLSTRDPRMPENQCNFPSKIIEGLLHNRIIISTIDYTQLNPIKYLKIDASNLEHDLVNVVNMPKNALLEYANQAMLTDQMFNARRWAYEIGNIERESFKHVINKEI
ncbi:MAG: hypothetical protein K2J62_04635 [Bacteroidales bacterium]|nr:hypothetical protein [Bacteroidales bacterium]